MDSGRPRSCRRPTGLITWTDKCSPLRRPLVTRLTKESARNALMFWTSHTAFIVKRSHSLLAGIIVVARIARLTSRSKPLTTRRDTQARQ
jgi:hypothetical protein